MAKWVFASVLAMALVFMLYVLANFYFEVRRPRPRTPRYRKGVIDFRTTSRRPVAPLVASCVRQAAPSTADVEAAKGDISAVVLPIGVRRLAAKRAPRS